MTYQVFARKYRPQTFEEVLGQSHVAGTLENSLLGDRLAHAYLFCGPRGVGKTTMARLLAKAVNCLESPGPRPCGKCETCTGIAAGLDVDVLEIDAASNRKVEDVETLIDATRYLPQRAPRKIFIVDEVHMLSGHAFNSLLKTLEEPPAHVLFVFATTEPQKMPETVRSRCQRFDFKRITESDIVKKLTRIVAAERAEVEPPVLEEIAARAAGGLRDAESLLDQLLGASGHTTADLLAILGEVPKSLRTRLLAQARDGEMEGVLESAAKAVESGADPIGLLKALYADVHELAVARARGADEGFSMEWCLASAELLQRHQRLARESRVARATLDLALLAMARLGSVRDLEELVERLERIGGGGGPGVAAGGAGRAGGTSSSKPRLRDELEKLQHRPRGELDARARPDQNEALSSNELASIRAHPRVSEVLGTFEGHIEDVRRTDG